MSIRHKLFALSDNQRNLISGLRDGEEYSRNVLADQLNISPQTMMRAVNPLVELGIISELEEINTDRSRGKPPRIMKLRKNSIFVLGVSIAEGRIIVEIRDFLGNRVDRVVEVREFETARAQVERLKSSIQSICEGFEQSERILSLGAVAQGFFAERGRRIIQRKDPEGWASIDLKSELEDTSALPTTIVNDGHAFASSLIGLSETRNFMAIVLAKGVGAGIVIDGRLAIGNMGNAGEIGRLVGGDEFRPTEQNCLKTLGREDWENWGGISDLPEDKRIRLDKWCVVASKKLEKLLTTCNAMVDADCYYIGSRMPLDVLQRLTNNIKVKTVVDDFNLARDDREFPSPQIKPVHVENFSAFASEIAVRAYLSPNQINLRQADDFVIAFENIN